MAKQRKSKGRVVDFNKALEEKEKKKKVEQSEKEPAIEISERTEASVARHKKKHRRRVSVYVLVILIMLGIVGMLAHNVISLKIEQNKLKSEITDLEKKKKELQKEKKTVMDPDYVEEQARKQLRMIKPGEILYVLPKDEKNDK